MSFIKNHVKSSSSKSNFLPFKSDRVEDLVVLVLVEVAAVGPGRRDLLDEVVEPL